MQSQLVPIESVRPYPKNSRAHSSVQILRIAKSIKEFGFNQPLVIDEDNEVLVGHGRLLAAQELKLAEIPVVKIEGLTNSQKKAYRILDNKLQNESTWEYLNLEQDLLDLQKDGFVFEPWGLEDLAREIPKTEPTVSEDEFEAVVSVAPYIKPGDEIVLNNHKLFCSDARTHDYGQASFDMMITDPPYGVSYVGKTKDALTIESDDIDEESLSNLWGESLDRALVNLKNGAAIYVAAPGGPLCTVFENALKLRGILRQGLVWLKNSLVMGRSDYHYKHEPILYGWKPGAPHYSTEDRTKTSVLEFDRPSRSAEHPTMKPVLLWAELIKNSSKTGETVLDPFCGSGTTLIACEQLGRVSYCLEIDPAYCCVIIERYKSYCETNKKPFICKINGESFGGT